MVRIKLLFIVFLFSLNLLLPSCVSKPAKPHKLYMGHELPREKIAHINIWNAYIDNVWVNSKAGAYVIPGNHAVKVQWSGRFVETRSQGSLLSRKKMNKVACTVNFEAEAGKSYGVQMVGIRERNFIKGKARGPGASSSGEFEYANASIFEKGTNVIVGRCRVTSLDYQY